MAQLPPLSYAQVRSVLEKRAKQIGSDGETPFDQRLADALVSLTRGEGGTSGAPVVVAHVPFEVWADPESELVGELERGGLISADVARRLACDARRSSWPSTTPWVTPCTRGGPSASRPTPSGARSGVVTATVSFLGCHNVLFTNCHHIEEWEHGGLTDLPNLALMCEHHHHLIHSKLWSMSGDANVELRFVGPSGDVMTTRPSRLWARVSDPKVLAERRARLRDGPDEEMKGTASGRDGPKNPPGDRGRQTGRSPDPGG